MLKHQARNRLVAIGLWILGSVLVAPSAVASSCGWHVESLAINATAHLNQPGPTSFDYPLSEPVSMEDVTAVQLDFYDMTKIGAGKVSATIREWSTRSGWSSIRAGRVPIPARHPARPTSTTTATSTSPTS